MKWFLVFLTTCTLLAFPPSRMIPKQRQVAAGGGGTDNNVVHDANIAGGTFTTTTPHEWTHIPVGTPKGIVVVIAHGTESTDLITSVSYGGTAMTRVNTAADAAAGEPGRAYIYFLGASVPTGNQTVSIVHSGATTVKWARSISVTADSAGTTGVSGGIIEEDATDPQIAVDSGADTALRYILLYHGGANASAQTPLANMTALSNNDFGAFIARVDRETTKSSGSTTVGYTATIDDVAMCTIYIK